MPGSRPSTVSRGAERPPGDHCRDPPTGADSGRRARIRAGPGCPKSPARGRTNLIGFVVRDISDPMFADIVKGAEQNFRVEGYHASVMNSLGERALDSENIDVLRKRRVDGVILSLVSETHLETLLLCSGWTCRSCCSTER